MDRGGRKEGALKATTGASARDGRLIGALLAGLLLASLLEIAALAGLGALRGAPAFAPVAERFSRFLYDGGWLTVPLWGGALGLLAGSRWTTGRRRGLAWTCAALLAALPLIARPALRAVPGAQRPATARAKATAILRWAYRTPTTVDSILALSTDPSPIVREQVMLALGVNLIVSDLEHASADRPARFAALPLRTRMRDRLLAALATDSVESVRAEAARALWNAPRTYGVQRAAADTLVAVLDRATRPAAIERLTWLALDAAAGAPDSALRQAARR